MIRAMVAPCAREGARTRKRVGCCFAIGADAPGAGVGGGDPVAGAGGGGTVAGGVLCARAIVGAISTASSAVPMMRAICGIGRVTRWCPRRGAGQQSAAPPGIWRRIDAEACCL